MATRRDQAEGTPRGSPRPVRDALIRALTKLIEEALARSDRGDDKLLFELDALFEKLNLGKVR